MIIALVICIAIIVFLSIQYYRVKKSVIEVNQQRQEENKQLEIRNAELKQKSAGIQTSIEAQNNILKSLKKTNEQLQEDAEARAQEFYEARKKELTCQLQSSYEQAAAGYQEQIDTIVKRKLQEEQKLKDIEDKQFAYIEAQKRQEEMEANRDYYRLVISEIDQQDIKALRELQLHFYRKESIDKLIWEVYYKPAYDALVSRLFANKSKVCGIYKITDLTSGASYIGQSVDIKERFRQHIKASLAFSGATNKLYQTLQKVGQYNFTFEVLEEVDRTKLNERETYWIDFYKTKEFGLNSTKGGS